jgi:hypothetical protein
VLRTEVIIDSGVYSALVDTGASISAVNPEILPLATNSIVSRQKIPPFSFKLSVGNSPSLCVREIVTLKFFVNSVLCSWKFYVIPGLSNHIVIGMDWLRKNSVFLDCNKQCIVFGHIPDPIRSKPSTTPQIQEIQVPIPAKTEKTESHATTKKNKKSTPVHSICKRSKCIASVENYTLQPLHMCPIKVTCSDPNYNGDILVTRNKIL